MITHTNGTLNWPNFDRDETQFAVIRDLMLASSARGNWLTLAEIAEATEFGEASISAQLRHLRKVKFGHYRVEKRRRELLYASSSHTAGNVTPGFEGYAPDAVAASAVAGEADGPIGYGDASAISCADPAVNSSAGSTCSSTSNSSADGAVKPQVPSRGFVGSLSLRSEPRRLPEPQEPAPWEYCVFTTPLSAAAATAATPRIAAEGVCDR